MSDDPSFIGQLRRSVNPMGATSASIFWSSTSSLHAGCAVLAVVARAFVAPSRSSVFGETSVSAALVFRLIGRHFPVAVVIGLA